MNIRLLLVLLLIIPSVIAEEKIIETFFYIKTTNETINIKTENSDFIYTCQQNVTENKTIFVKRNITTDSKTDTKDCTDEILLLSNTFSSIGHTCNNTIKALNDNLKDSKSFSQLYNDCTNQLTEAQSEKGFKALYNECSLKQSDAQSQLTQCNTDKGSYQSQFSTCNTDNTALENKIEKKEKNELLFRGGFAVAGAGLAYWFFVGRKKIKSRRESMGIQERGRE